MELALAKVKGENLCKKFKGGTGNHLRNLSHPNQKVADGAKKAALEILQDALDKKLYGTPVDYLRSCNVDPDPYKYSSMLTQELLENMIEKMKKVTFLEDTNPEHSNVFAYVYQHDQSCKVYLCHYFWGAGDHLSKDSKPGTLIHEVSHFLGTEDLHYDFVWIELHEKMGKLFGRPFVCEDGVKKPAGWDMSDSQSNANCIEYEFEMILNHKEAYSVQDKKYPCCDETKINSVCVAGDIGHYINCQLYKAAENTGAKGSV